MNKQKEEKQTVIFIVEKIEEKCCTKIKRFESNRKLIIENVVNNLKRG